MVMDGSWQPDKEYTIRKHLNIDEKIRNTVQKTSAWEEVERVTDVVLHLLTF